MESNEIIKKQINRIVTNQLLINDPLETKLTYNRLTKLGYSDFDSKQLIGQCVAIEIFNILKYRKPFDKVRYLKNLQKLPNEPFD